MNNALSKDYVTACYFYSVSIENVRCFSSRQTIHLSKIPEASPSSWTIILGDNGTGKTTLLECLAQMHLVRSVYSPYKENTPFPSNTHFVPLAYAGFPGFAPQFARELRPDQPDYIVEAEYWIEESSKNNGRIIKTSFNGRNGLVLADTYPVELLLNEHIVYCYAANRKVGHLQLADRKSGALDFSESYDLLDPVEWLLQTDYSAAKGNPNAKDHLEKIKRTLIRLLPDVLEIIIDQPEGAKSPQVQFRTHYGWVRFNQISLGYQSSLTWMIDLAAHLFDDFPNSENPLAESAVVIVDEIDLHLHPKWQRTLLQTLSDTFPNIQFIATAHSPLVVQAIPDANIVLLKREGDHVVIDHNPENIKGWRVDQILTSELFDLPSARPPQLDAFLQERTEILSKATLSDGDRRRLNEIESIVSEMPEGETKVDMDAMDIIRRAAKLLEPQLPKQL